MSMVSSLELLPGELVDDRAFEALFESIAEDVNVALSAVFSATNDALDRLSAECARDEGVRRTLHQPFSYDSKKFTKSWSSARDKLLRERGAEPFTSRDEVATALRAFSDLGRFRVVFTLLSDVTRALDAWLSDAKSGGRYLDRYTVVDFKDFVFDLERINKMRMRGGGHRARQFSVRVEDNVLEPVNIEIQLMTVLQHAWDQRNHPLYEMLRAGGALSPQAQLSDLAMSETLYLLDCEADRVWLSVLEERKKAGER
jgi:ppGpp synthetase/RelA/SpoT-type nucleotidyltranferase